MGLNFKLSFDAVLHFQDTGPSLPSRYQVCSGRGALLSALYPLAIVLSPLMYLYAYRAGVNGKGLLIWELATYTSMVFSEGPAEGIGPAYTHVGSECISFLSSERQVSPSIV